ncbi:diguanylate cyclase [Denitrovibrio acetiphilus DSM 12809]|uniref:diguanylate cyclase n=1 Tax=Denitrovibrio acetiphilus (strain DSM 12809 / NBRC 114555 / N2460) TaxID=522772 RepID=D4H0H9_DENA2|nr:diguanylate cyclase [Denitrovibrio acetiphilus DSM 12809]
MKTIKNKTSLFIIVGTLLTVGFLITNLISYYAAKNTMRDSIINTSLPLTRDNIYSEIQRDIMLPVYVASLMANDTFLKDWVINGEEDLSTIQKYLREIKFKYHLFTSFYVSEKTKHYYYYGGLLKTLSKNDSHDKWYDEFISQHVPYELVVDTNQAANNALTIFINHRVYDYEHNLLGVTGVGLDLERITNLLSAYRVKYNRDIYLVDQEGLIKAHSDKELVEAANIRLMPGIKDIAHSVLNISQHSEDFEYNRHREHILLTKRYIPELRWFLLVEQSQDKAIANIWYNFIKSTILGLLVTAIVVFIIMSSVNYYNRRLERLAITDELTGSYNRREFSRIYDKAVQWYKKNEEPFSVILVDIDNFKIINDAKGHAAGDSVIKAVTRICKNSIRGNDLIARWGGDEFIMLIYGDSNTASTIAERIQRYMSQDEELLTITSDIDDITLSIGISEYTVTDSEDSITIRADKALYSAKESGRNKVIITQSPQKY